MKIYIISYFNGDSDDYLPVIAKSEEEALEWFWFDVTGGEPQEKDDYTHIEVGEVEEFGWYGDYKIKIIKKE